jgi:hypothetical protein
MSTYSTRITKRLLDPKFGLISEIYQHKVDQDEFAVLLYNFFHTHKKERALLKWAITQGVKNATTAGVLFREESVLTKLLSIAWNAQGGRIFVHNIVKTIIDDIKETCTNQSIEVRHFAILSFFLT